MHIRLLSVLITLSTLSAQGPSTDSLSTCMNLDEYGIVPIDRSSAEISPLLRSDGSSSGSRTMTTTNLEFDGFSSRISVDSSSEKQLSFTYKTGFNWRASRWEDTDSRWDRTLDEYREISVPLSVSFIRDKKNYRSADKFRQLTLLAGLEGTGLFSHEDRRSISEISFSSNHEKNEGGTVSPVGTAAYFPFGRGRIVSVTAPVLGAQILEISKKQGVPVKEISAESFKKWSVQLDSLNNRRVIDRRIERGDDLQKIIDLCPAFDSAEISYRDAVQILDLWEMGWSQRRERGSRFSAGASCSGVQDFTLSYGEKGSIYASLNDTLGINPDSLMNNDLPLRYREISDLAFKPSTRIMPSLKCRYEYRKPLKLHGQYDLNIYTHFAGYPERAVSKLYPEESGMLDSESGEIYIGAGNGISLYPTYRTTFSNYLNVSARTSSDYNIVSAFDLKSDLYRFISPHVRLYGTVTGLLRIKDADPTFSYTASAGIIIIRR